MKLVLLYLFLLSSLSAWTSSPDCISKVHSIIRESYQTPELDIDGLGLYDHFSKKNVEQLSDNEINDLNLKVIEKLNAFSTLNENSQLITDIDSEQASKRKKRPVCT